jgi:hypothetical protein
MNVQHGRMFLFASLLLSAAVLAGCGATRSAGVLPEAGKPAVQIEDTLPPGPVVFAPTSLHFALLNSLLGGTQTSIVSQDNNILFTLPTNAVSCPSGFLGVVPVTATIAKHEITVTLGLLNLDLLGTCNVTVDGADGTEGQLPVTFTLF